MPDRPQVFKRKHHSQHRRKQRNNRQATREYATNSRIWRQIRQSFLFDNPLCAHHLARGETVAANEVDHIDGDSNNNPADGSNYQALCKSCHSRKTAREQQNAIK